MAPDSPEDGEVGNEENARGRPGAERGGAVLLILVAAAGLWWHREGRPSSHLLPRHGVTAPHNYQSNNGKGLSVGNVVTIESNLARRRDDFTEHVGECASPKKGGYVYGAPAADVGVGDTKVSRVLRFVHRDRGRVEAGETSVIHSPSSLWYRRRGFPSLEDTILKVWAAKREAGVLWFDAKDLEVRRDVGKETGWECVFVSNPGRSKPFPPPEPAESPWDPSKFNFYKADPLEFMFEYVPSFEQHARRKAEELLGGGGTSGGYDKPDDPAGGESKKGTRGEQRRLPALPEMTESVGNSMGVDLVRQGRREGGQRRRQRRGVRGGGESAGERFLLEHRGRKEHRPVFSVECGDVSDASPPEHAVIVNVRPVGPVSVLLTPGYARSLHQRATPEALAVAMDFAEALMRTSGNFRLGFNSGGSSASVNHLHFQCWFFNAGSRGMPLEVAPTVFAAALELPVEPKSEYQESKMEVHTLDDGSYPIRGLVFHTLGKDLEAVGQVIAKCVDVLVRDDTPHTMLFSQGRAFLLPRRPLKEPPFAAVPGFPEVSGEVIITSEADFPTVDADTVFRFWRNHISVGEERFREITEACLSKT